MTGLDQWTGMGTDNSLACGVVWKPCSLLSSYMHTQPGAKKSLGLPYQNDNDALGLSTVGLCNALWFLMDSLSSNLYTISLVSDKYKLTLVHVSIDTIMMCLIILINT